MKIIWRVTDVQIHRKIEVNKPQHLYYTADTMQAMYFFIQKLFLRVLVLSCGMMTAIKNLWKIF